MNEWLSGSRVMERWNVDQINLIQCITDGLPVYDHETLAEIKYLTEYKNIKLDKPLFVYTNPWGKPKTSLEFNEMRGLVDKCQFKHDEVERFEKEHPRLLKQGKSNNITSGEPIPTNEPLHSKDQLEKQQETRPNAASNNAIIVESWGENFFIHHGDRGDYWDVGYQGGKASFKDTNRIRYIAYLLNSPGKDVHVFEMMNSVTGNTLGEEKDYTSNTSVPQLKETRDYRDLTKLLSKKDSIVDMAQDQLEEDEGLSISKMYINDPEARSNKKLIEDQLEELEDNLEQAKERGIQEEIEEIEERVKKWKAALKVYEEQKTNPELDKARKNIGKAIKDGIEDIRKKTLHGLAKHLEQRIQKGTTCVYMPDPNNPIEWVIKM